MYLQVVRILVILRMVGCSGVGRHTYIHVYIWLQVNSVLDKLATYQLATG